MAPSMFQGMQYPPVHVVPGMHMVPAQQGSPDIPHPPASQYPPEHVSPELHVLPGEQHG